MCLFSLQKLSAYNTRLFKKEGGGKTCYEVRLASAVTTGEGEEGEVRRRRGT